MSEASDADRLQAAQDAVRYLGAAVIPVHYVVDWDDDHRPVCSCREMADCPSVGKHPMTLAWTTRAATSGPDVQALWEQDPRANVGVVTGTMSGGLLVLDVDVDKGGMDSYDRLFTPPPGEFRLASPTRRHETGGGGFHLVYRLPAGITVTSRPLSKTRYPGIDIRADDGMVVWPTSVSGKGPYTTTDEPSEPATRIPGWLLEIILAEEKTTVSFTDDGQYAQPAPVDAQLLPQPLRAALAETGTPKGERSEKFFNLVCAVREAGCSEGQALTLLAPWCAYCDPPLYMTRLGREVHRVWGKHTVKQKGLELPGVPATNTVPNMTALAFALDPVPTVAAPQAEPGAWAPPRVIPHPELDGKLDEAFPEFDFHGMWEHAEDPPDWVWEPFLEREGHIALYSEAKQGKSLVVLEAVAALCSGQLPPGATVAQAPKHVAYVDRENPRKAIVKRLRAMGFKPEQFLPYLHYYRYPQVPPLDSADGGMLFVRQMLRVAVELVIIDTTSKFITGDEDKADTINALDRHTIQPLTRAGISVLRLDHAGKDATRGQRGSSAKAAIGDGSYRLTRLGDWVHLKGELRNDDSPEEFLFIRRRDPLRHDVATTEEKEAYEEQLNDDGRPSPVKRSPGRPRKSTEEKVAPVADRIDKAFGEDAEPTWDQAYAAVGGKKDYITPALRLRRERRTPLKDWGGRGG